MSFQFLPLSGSTGHGYVLKLFLVKSHKIANISTANCAQEKMSTDLESLELKKIMEVLLKKHNFT